MDIWSTARVGLVCVVGFSSLIWLLSLKLRDASIVDRVWGLIFLVLSASYTFTAGALDVRKVVVLCLVAIWSIRLSVHIHIRNRGHAEDYRYQAMRAEHGPAKFWWYSFFSVFLLQAILAFFISAPLLSVAHFSGPPTVTVFDVAGLLIWSIGFYFEAVGDWQLVRFKKNPSNKGKLLTTGLWSLTRHPNYFGDATLWWGFFLLAVSVPWGALTFFGPLLMTFFIIKVSGVQLLEKNLVSSKPGYEAYIKDTPAFVPRLSFIFRKYFK